MRALSFKKTQQQSTMTTLTPRVSPSSKEEAYDMPWTTSKKPRFRRRKRGSSGTMATYVRSQSSMSLDSHSTHSTDVPGKQKKKSLLKKLLGKSHKKSMLIETQPQQEAHHPEDPTASTSHEDSDVLEERGHQLHLAGQVEDALETWKEALALSQSDRIRCRLINLYVADDKLEEARSVIQQLQQPRVPQSCNGSKAKT